MKDNIHKNIFQLRILNYHHRYKIKNTISLPKRIWKFYINNAQMTDRTFWYLQGWKLALTPVCRQLRGSTFKECVDFRPSFSNEGLCFTRNGGKFDDMFKSTHYASSFKEVMLSGRENDSIQYTKGSGMQYQYTFVVDTNQEHDFKRGRAWKFKHDANIQLGIHSPNDIADIKGSGIDIHPGYETTLRINFQELYSDPSIQNLDPIRRQCKFDDENKDMKVFKWYSRVNCLFECSMDIIAKECGCRPWDYPSGMKNISEYTSSLEYRICDYFGNTCFHAMMSTDLAEKQCAEKCLPDCNEVKHTFSIEKSPFNPKSICHLSKEYQKMGAFSDQRMKKGVKDLEESLKNHVFGNPQSPPKWDKSYPINKLIQTLQDAIRHPNETTSKYDTCVKRLMNDVAVIHIVVNNPTVLKLIQTNRVTFSDKVANFGKFNKTTCLANNKRYYL